MKRLRQQTVEPVLGSLMEYYGLGQLRVRGKSSAHKVMLMAAISDRRCGLQPEEVYEVHHQVHFGPGHSAKSGVVLGIPKHFSRL